MQKRPTVLVVDDDACVLRAVGRLLRSAGFEARTFERPTLLLASALPSADACLLLDVYLPEMNGSGENQVIIFPNGMISIRAAKAAELPPGEKVNSGTGEMTAEAVDRLQPF